MLLRSREGRWVDIHGVVVWWTRHVGVVKAVRPTKSGEKLLVGLLVNAGRRRRRNQEAAMFNRLVMFYCDGCCWFLKRGSGQRTEVMFEIGGIGSG